MKNLSRRSFLKGAAGAAAVTAVSAMGLVPAMAEEAAADIAWDAEYDVVVMGMGFAGTSAAIAAADKGVSVLLVDKAPKGATGGNSKVSGQAIQATDDPDAFYTYLRQMIGDYADVDDDVLRAYVDGAYNQYEWLVNTMGADPDILCPAEYWDFEHRANFHTEPTTGFKGGKAGYAQNWDEFPDFEGHDHCFVLFVSGREADAAFYTLCLQNVEKRAIDVWYQAPGKHLITDADGNVIGCKIVKDGKLLNIKANGGVVLACGGFENNSKMVSSFMQRPYIYCRAAVYNEGDGVKMGMEVGADLWHMSNGAAFMWGHQTDGAKTCTSPSSVTKGILVGPGGTRFMNESAEARHGRIDIGGSWIMMPTPNPTWYIIDNDQIGTKICSTFSDANANEIESGEVIVGETLAELAEKLGVPADALQTTVDKYNAAYDAGVDADYGRPFSTMTPVKNGPFYALKLGPTMLNTQGGPRRNQYAQVVRPSGSPIQGLFSGGELGALWPDMYNGGGNIGEAAIFGRMAGGNAADRALGNFVGAPDVEEVIEAAENAEENYSYEGTQYADGVYTATGTGYGGDVTLTATVEGGKFTDIQVESNETDAIGGVAIPDLVEQAKAGRTAWTDAVSGASLTTHAFEEALQKIIAQASWH